MARTLIGVRCTVVGREATLMARPLEALHSESRGDMADLYGVIDVAAAGPKMFDVRRLNGLMWRLKC